MHKVAEYFITKIVKLNKRNYVSISNDKYCKQYGLKPKVFCVKKNCIN